MRFSADRSPRSAGSHELPAERAGGISAMVGAPASLTRFNLSLGDDGDSCDPIASEFQLFAGSQLVADVQILDTYRDESNTSVYDSNYIDISDTLRCILATSNYTLEFIQNQQESETSGVRALEFEASNTPNSVPEPTASSLLASGCIALCVRRKRTR